MKSPDSHRLAMVSRWLVLALVAGFAMAQGEAPRKHALLIGIDQSGDTAAAGFSELHWAAKDAQELSDFLDDNGWDARALKNEGATREFIVKQFVRLAKEARPQDTVLIYFAGHGVRYKTGRDHTYWVTHYSALETMPIHGIRLSHLLEYIQDIPAERKILLLDHCYSGDVEEFGAGEGDGSRDAGGGSLRIVPRNLFPKDDFRRAVEARVASGLVVFGAARDKAYEFEELGHGLMTHSLLQAFSSPQSDDDSDGELSLNEVWNHAKRTMDNIATQKGLTQVPISIIRGDTDLVNLTLVPASGLSNAQVAAEAKELKKVVFEVYTKAHLRDEVYNLCLQVISNWETAQSAGISLAEADREILEEIRKVKDLGTTVTPEVNRDRLELKFDNLGF